MNLTKRSLDSLCSLEMGVDSFEFLENAKCDSLKDNI